MLERVRQPIVVVLGHVDSGKTSLLDKIRGTAVQAREVGGITQHIGASYFPMDTLNKICGSLLQKVGGAVTIPGLLVIDTPGHEVFSNLRTRGGSAADISILVVDATKGFEVQTYESIEILRQRKVPFVLALNKIDMISGWRSTPSVLLSQVLKSQDKVVLEDLDNRIYQAVGNLSRLGFLGEAFYRIKDYTKEIAIVPVSARKGVGIPELIAVLIGLTQQYLANRLTVKDGLARGIILEVKEEPGLGQTANLILIEGTLKTGDKVVLMRREGTLVSRIKAMFLPKPLDEMRDPRDRFSPVEEVRAAAGVKIATPDLENVLPGSPLIVIETDENMEEAKKIVEKEVSGIFVKTDVSGIIIKSDTLGSLEAIIQMLKQKQVAIRLADIGPVTRRDVVEAAAVAESNKYLGVILAFTVKILPDAQDEIETKSVKVFAEPVIYNLIQNYLNWVTEEKEVAERNEFSSLTPPSSFKILKGLVFRRSNPAIFGVEVLTGRLRQKSQVINSEGKTIGIVHQIQDKGKNLEEVMNGAQVAISMNEPQVGRHVIEGEALYSLPNEKEVKLLLEKYLTRLDESEQQTLKKIIESRRKVSPFYGF